MLSTSYYFLYIYNVRFTNKTFETDFLLRCRKFTLSLENVTPAKNVKVETDEPIGPISVGGGRHVQCTLFL